MSIKDIVHESMGAVKAADAENKKKIQEARENGWKNGIDIPNFSAYRENNFEDKGKTRDNAYKSLRSGEDYHLDDGSNGGKGTTFAGGIKGLRYLGRGEGDVLNPNYFSDENNLSGKVLQLRMSDFNNVRGGQPTMVGDFSVYYDDDGAIAMVIPDSDIMFNNGKKYKKGNWIRGSKNLSNFFNDMGIAADDSDYLITDRRSNASGRYGGNVSNNIAEQAPTRIFGSQGVFNPNRTTYGGSQRNWYNTFSTDWDAIGKLPKYEQSNPYGGPWASETVSNEQAFDNYKQWKDYQKFMGRNNKMAK